MKHKKLGVFALGVGVALSSGLVASAAPDSSGYERNTTGQGTGSVEVKTETHATAKLPLLNADGTTTTQVRAETGREPSTRDDSRMNEERNSDGSYKDSGEKREDGTERKENHSNMGDAHRSAVALFVQKLHALALREDGIGAQVRVIAQAQNDSNERTSTAIAKIEKRDVITSFLVGTDYKSLRELRLQLVATTAHIKELKALVETNTSTTAKAELEAEIKVLEKIQADMNALIVKNENKFSLFGWLLKTK